MNMYMRLMELVKPHWRRLGVASLCMIGTGACTAGMAYLLQPVADDIFINKQENRLYVLSLVVLLIFVFKGLCSYGNVYLMNYVGQRVIAQLRQKLYGHIQSLSLSFLEKVPTAS